MCGILSNMIGMRLSARTNARGTTIALVGTCTMLASTLTAGFGAERGAPGVYYWGAVVLNGLAAFFSPSMRSLLTATAQANGDGKKSISGGGGRDRPKANLTPTSVLGAVAAVECLTDVLVPIIFGFSVWKCFVNTLDQPRMIFLALSVFFVLAGMVLLGNVACTSTRRQEADRENR